MQHKIKRLSNEAINQIAAGEVVEHPASVIKELIENSLDANASQIQVRIEKGGQTLIEVEDNGEGMTKDDAILSIERHATSKISSSKDLSHLTTMGFRGEALAAITSVSYFEIKTSTGDVGTCIRGKGGVIDEVLPCARNKGTTISIHSLFFNTPARKKFQKSPSSNTMQVTKVVEQMALANEEVRFSYHSNGEEIYFLEAEDRLKRVERLLGPFEFQAAEGPFWGLFGAPDLAKQRRSNQYLFVNRRPVFSPLIARAVQTAYATRIKEGSFPSFAFFLDLEPTCFDINVHPQKKEIRFSSESALFSEVERFCAKAITKELAMTSSSRQPIFFDPSPSFAMKSSPYFEKSQEEQVPFSFDVAEKVLAVIGKYLLIEKEEILLVDLASARARIFFEEVGEKNTQAQTLLFPIEVEEKDPERIQLLQEVGIENRQIGPSRFAIDALPSGVDPDEFEEFYVSMKKGSSLRAAFSKYFSSSKKMYSKDEALHLWKRLQKCKDSLFDPLGRRIWKKLEISDLEKLLGR